MKAIYIREHGPVAGLQANEVPEPSPKAGEVLVKIEAAGINPSDVSSVEGRFPGSVLPRIVGRDFAGVVVEGPAEFRGVKVWGSGGDLGINRDGSHAEFITLPQTAAAPRPKNLSAEEAAIAGVPYLAAYMSLFRLGRLQKGEWVIISGAAGAVGQAAIQLAKAKGAGVIALIKSTSERGPIEAAGVTAIAESDEGDLEVVTREVTDGKGADLALNGVGGIIFGPLFAALKTGGRQVVYSVAGGREVTLDLQSLYKRRHVLLGLDTQKLNATECAGILNEITPLFESGALAPPKVGEQLSLSQAAEAYGRVASHKGGKIAFRMAV